MIQISVIVGLVFSAFLCLYFAKMLLEMDRARFYFIRMLCIMFFLVFFMLIPQYMIANKDHCDIMVSNSTVSGSTSTYNYSYECFENESSVFGLLLKIVTWFFNLIILGFALYLVWYAITEWLLKNDNIRKLFRPRQ